MNIFNSGEKKVYISIALIILVLFIFTSCQSVAKKNVFLENVNVGELNKKEIEQKIENLSKSIKVEAQDAIYDNKQWAIVKTEKNGKKVNIEKTLNQIMNAKEGEKIKLVVEETYPKILSNQYIKDIAIIGSFETKLLDKLDSRITNIELGVKNINTKILKTNEEFSFNQMLGQRTEGKGYELAPIIVKTENGYEKGYGVGGGICQLSTTIF